jgi:hypothetical protein
LAASPNFPPFYESLHENPRIREVIYEAGNDFMGGELNETVNVHDIHRIIKATWEAAESYCKTGAVKRILLDD